MYVAYKRSGKTVRACFSDEVDYRRYLPGDATEVREMTDDEAREHEAALEAENRSAEAARTRKADAERRARALLDKTIAETATFTDAQLVDVATLDIFDTWAAGRTYSAGKRLMHGGNLYVVVQGVTAQAHQAPDAAGMLAVYRLIDPATGTVDDPKTLAVGMAVAMGLHYRYNGTVYRLARAMAVTVQGQMPGDPGMGTFWVAV